MKPQTAALFLLVIIYFAFISLGLPDSILGIAWPSIRLDFNRPLEAAGILTVLGTLCSAASSILSGHVLARFGTGKVTFVSCLMTAAGLLGYSLSPSFYWLLPCIPFLGFGAGAIDSGLNYYVAANYSSRHMNWLHCCWGIGATVGPMILTAAITGRTGWRAGYRTIALMQLALSALLFASLGLWIRVRNDRAAAGIANARIANAGIDDTGNEHAGPSGTGGPAWESGMAIAAVRKKAIISQITIYAVYASCEFLVGLWSFSLLVEKRGLAPVIAGAWVAAYYGALTAARFSTGLVVNRLGNRFMIRLGLTVALAGTALFSAPFFFPALPAATALAGLILLGAGFAPVYPCMTHETPRRFQEATAQKIMGYQVGSACLGGALFPALVGLVAARTSLEILPFTVAALIAATLALNTGLERMTARGAL